MSGSGLPAPEQLQRLQRLQASAPDRRLGDNPLRRRPAPTASRIAWRRRTVWLTKWSLPLLALLLLGAVAAWPELTRVKEQGRVAFRRVFSVDPESGRMLQPRYRGVDERGRPYTITAASAQQTSVDRIALAEPKGDVVTENGSWVMVEARQGVYIQRQSLMDLSHDVVLYREDGTRLATDAVALDLKAGAATSSDKTHAEGPFGVLDAQGFILTDKGAVIQFQGASHLVLNEGEKK